MNLKEKRNASIIAPEEMPPNNYSAAKQQNIPLKDPPWNEWLRLARQGDKEATLLFCTQAEPFIELFCRISYFRHFLGEEEIRGIAALKVMEFLIIYMRIIMKYTKIIIYMNQVILLHIYSK